MSEENNKRVEAGLTEKVKRRVPGQQYVVLNIVGPGLRQVTKKTAFRILGCFDSEKEAREYADDYKPLDDRFDIYLCSMYEFLPIPTEVHDVGDVRYAHEEINELLDVHQKTRTQTESWNNRLEEAHKSGQDAWGDLTL